jgi:hypothetical protein
MGVLGQGQGVSSAEHAVPVLRSKISGEPRRELPNLRRASVSTAAVAPFALPIRLVAFLPRVFGFNQVRWEIRPPGSMPKERRLSLALRIAVATSAVHG